jgi:hypothetical protein
LSRPLPDASSMKCPAVTGAENPSTTAITLELPHHNQTQSHPINPPNSLINIEAAIASTHPISSIGRHMQHVGAEYVHAHPFIPHCDT